MIRLIIACFAILLFFIFSIILIPIEWIIGKFSVSARDRSRQWILRTFMKLLLLICGVKQTVIGLEKVPTDVPVLYILNHRSFFDIILSLAHFPGLVGFIAKDQFRHVPLLSWWIRWTHGFFLDRENIREGLKTILAAIDEVKAGYSMAICPEGTRNRGPDDRELLPFHAGSFKIATKSLCPIIPVSISNTSAIFEDHIPFVRSTKVVMEFGTPIDTASLTREEQKNLCKNVQSIIAETLKKNHIE